MLVSRRSSFPYRNCKTRRPKGGSGQEPARFGLAEEEVSSMPQAWASLFENQHLRTPLNVDASLACVSGCSRSVEYEQFPVPHPSRFEIQYAVRVRAVL